MKFPIHKPISVVGGMDMNSGLLTLITLFYCSDTDGYAKTPNIMPPFTSPPSSPSQNPVSSLQEVKAGSFIFEKKNALPDFLCDDMIKRFENNQADQYAGKVGAMMNNMQSIKKTTDLVVSGKQHWQDADNNLFRSLGMALNEFKQKFPYFSDMSRFQDMGYNLQRYQAGEYYHWHVDNDNLALASRQLVALWYLNDAPEQGGETEFMYQNIKVKPEKGKLILFPPFWTHEHRAIMVGKGVKYIATTWVTFR
jgi:predicted 2-oxoglutarate/Fe(II)-dependent dioxygenase YbiX